MKKLIKIDNLNYAQIEREIKKYIKFYDIPKESITVEYINGGIWLSHRI